MSTIIQSKKTLLTVALGGAIAMVLAFGSFAASAQALTQSQIDSILGLLESFGADAATVANVEATLTGGTPVTPAPAPVMDKFSRDLSVGSTGDDVKMLQQWLNENGYTVATSGAGSPGNETEYFGERTRQAVAAYQSANGISPVAGYFGPITKNAVNAEIAAATPAPVVPTPTNDEPSNDEPSNDEPSNDEPDDVGREGTINLELRADYRNVDVGMSQTRKVATYRVKAEDSRVNVQRIDIYVENENGDDAGDSLRDFRGDVDHLALYVGDNKVAETAVNRNTIGRDDTFIRFGGLNISVPRGGHADFTLEVTASDSETVDTYYLIGPMEDRSIRGVDTAGINIYTGDIAGRQFNLTGDDAGELDVSRNRNTPDEGLVVIGKDSFEEVLLLSFDVEVGDSDVDLDTVVAYIERLGLTASQVQDVVLKDGDTVLDVLSAPSTATGTLAFAADLELYAGETITLDIYADVSVEDIDEQGGALKASIRGTDNTTAGFDMTDNTIALSGNADGYWQSVYVTAPAAQLATSNITRSGDANEYGEASMGIDVTAVGGDIYFAEGGITVAGAWDAIFDMSNLDTEGDLDQLNPNDLAGLAGTSTVYVLRDGETKRLSVNAEITGVDAWVKLEIDEINWWAEDSDGNVLHFLFTKAMDDVDDLETNEVRVRSVN